MCDMDLTYMYFKLFRGTVMHIETSKSSNNVITTHRNEVPELIDG